MTKEAFIKVQALADEIETIDLWDAKQKPIGADPLQAIEFIYAAVRRFPYFDKDVVNLAEKWRSVLLNKMSALEKEFEEF